MAKKCCVYCHTSPSNKKYVGISINPTKRWNNGKGYIKNYRFDRAIQKYGWDSFKHEILYDNLSSDEAKEIETRLIAEWNLTDFNYGYNLRDGGDGSFSEESRAKMSKSRLGNTNSLGVKQTEENKKRISESLKKYYATHSHAMKGKHLSEERILQLKEREVSDETRKKMRENHCDVSGANNPSARRISQYDKDGNFIKEYDYAKQASIKYNLDLSSIIKCCRGKQRSCGGFVWKYA